MASELHGRGTFFSRGVFGRLDLPVRPAPALEGVNGRRFRVDLAGHLLPAFEPLLHPVPQGGLVVRGDAMDERGVAVRLRRELRRGDAGVGVALRVLGR